VRGNQRRKTFVRDGDYKAYKNKENKKKHLTIAAPA